MEEHRAFCDTVRSVFESNPTKPVEEVDEQIIVEYDLDEDFLWRT